jgi:hypothetical protein
LDLVEPPLSFDRRHDQPPRQYLHPKNRRNNNRLDRPTAWGKVHFAADPQKPDFPSSISETGSQQTASPRGESTNHRFRQRFHGLEITKEKQRVSEALDAQREKLTGRLGELEA